MIWDLKRFEDIDYNTVNAARSLRELKDYKSDYECINQPLTEEQKRQYYKAYRCIYSLMTNRAYRRGPYKRRETLCSD